MVLPGGARVEPFGGLADAVLLEGFDGPLGQFEDAPALAGLGVALARTDRYTATVPAAKSTSAQVSARASSVRMPASKETTT